MPVELNLRVGGAECPCCVEVGDGWVVASKQVDWKKTPNCLSWWSLV